MILTSKLLDFIEQDLVVFNITAFEIITIFFVCILLPIEEMRGSQSEQAGNRPFVMS